MIYLYAFLILQINVFSPIIPQQGMDGMVDGMAKFDYPRYRLPEIQAEIPASNDK